MIFQRRDMQPFNAVRFKGPGNMTISQAESQSLIIHGHESHLEKIRSEVVEWCLGNRLLPRLNSFVRRAAPADFLRVEVE